MFIDLIFRRCTKVSELKIKREKNIKIVALSSVNDGVDLDLSENIK